MNLIQKGEGPVYDSLLAGTEIPILKTQISLVEGQGILLRGSVIGLQEIDSAGRLCDKNSIDGSQIAKFILAEDVDTAEAVKAVCYKSGMFHRNALHFGENSTAEDHELELRMLNIHLREEY